MKEQLFLLSTWELRIGTSLGLALAAASASHNLKLPTNDRPKLTTHLKALLEHLGKFYPLKPVAEPHISWFALTITGDRCLLDQIPHQLTVHPLAVCPLLPD